MKNLTKSKLNSYYIASQTLLEVELNHLRSLKSTIQTPEEKKTFLLLQQYGKGGFLEKSTLGNLFLRTILLNIQKEEDHYAYLAQRLSAVSRTVSIEEFLEVYNLYQDDINTSVSEDKKEIMQSLLKEADENPESDMEDVCNRHKIPKVYAPDMKLFFEGQQATKELLKKLEII